MRTKIHKPNLFPLPSQDVGEVGLALEQTGIQCFLQNETILFVGCVLHTLHFGIFFGRFCNTSRRTPASLVLVPWFYQGMHFSRGSASFQIENESRTFVRTAGGACNSVSSKAEPWNQLVAFSEKCRFRSRFRLDLVQKLRVPKAFLHKFLRI